MSVTVTKGKGVTVFTVNSKEGSSWPLLCQILGTMCYSPASSVSQGQRRLQASSQSALGTIQIMVGVLNIGLGAILVSTDYYTGMVWGSLLFIAVGIMCILAEKFPSPCLVGINMLMNLSGASLAIAGIVLYSVDLMLMNALDIVLIVLQLCVTISSAVLGLKALYKNGKQGKGMKREPLNRDIQDLEQYKPLLEEVTTNPAA
uniref:Uncharacterized protein n=1 Tax=Salmo trutta TaxID=8032 RepID=A0A674CVZ9_SALTR